MSHQANDGFQYVLAHQACCELGHKALVRVRVLTCTEMRNRFGVLALNAF